MDAQELSQQLHWIFEPTIVDLRGSTIFGNNYRCFIAAHHRVMKHDCSNKDSKERHQVLSSIPTYSGRDMFKSSDITHEEDILI